MTTGPEIWEQTDGGEVAAIVVSGSELAGTITGVARYFKEHRPEVLIVGADPEGSIYTEDAQHPAHPYLVEGIGKDSLAADDGSRRRRRVGARDGP